MKVNAILKPFALFLCLIVLPCLLLAGNFIQPGLQTNIYREWLKIKKPVWQGVLTMWHVAGWDGASGSVSYWLNRRVKEFEKKNTGIFIEIQSISANELKSRISQGLFPDMLSFPTGVSHSLVDCLSEVLPDMNIRSEFLVSATSEGKPYAEPYAYSGYVLASNDDMLYEKQLRPPSPEGWNPMELQEAIAKNEQTGKGKKKGPSYGLCASSEDCVALASLLRYRGKGETTNALQILNSGTITIGNPVDEFAKKNTIASILSMGELRKLSGLQSQGKAPYCTVCPASSFTDMVQYIGIRKGNSTEKQIICQDFVDLLSSNKSQESLKDIGAFSVIRNFDSLYEGDERLALVEQAYKNDILVPNAFGYTDKREEIKGLINDVLAGNDKIMSLERSIESACKQ